jgi:hypothetical protein
MKKKKTHTQLFHARAHSTHACVRTIVRAGCPVCVFKVRVRGGVERGGDARRGRRVSAGAGAGAQAAAADPAPPRERPPCAPGPGRRVHGGHGPATAAAPPPPPPPPDCCCPPSKTTSLSLSLSLLQPAPDLQAGPGTHTHTKKRKRPSSRGLRFKTRLGARQEINRAGAGVVPHGRAVSARLHQRAAARALLLLRGHCFRLHTAKKNQHKPPTTTFHTVHSSTQVRIFPP